MTRPLVLLVFATILSGCCSWSDEDRDSLATSVALSERTVREVTQRSDVSANTLAFDADFKVADLISYLRLNSRNWIAVAVKQGVAPETEIPGREGDQ